MATQVTLNSGSVDSAGSLALKTNGTTTAVTIDASQNVGIGVTPSPWVSTWKAIDFSGPAVISGSTNASYIFANSYLNSSSQYVYKTSAEASIYQQSGGAHIFYNGASGTAGNTFTPTERMRINSGAPILCLSGGNQSATGTGIAFPAAFSGSSDVNTLDDYEEGTWTPTLSSTGTPPTVTSYTDRIGYFTKVGNLVTVICELRATLSAAGTGTVSIVLPFTARAGTLAPAALGLRDLLTGTVSTYTSGDTLFFAGATYVTGSSPYLVFFMTYQVA
jgi:hypothetical protein